MAVVQDGVERQDGVDSVTSWSANVVLSSADHQFYRRSVHYGIQSNTDLFSVISAAAALLRSGVRSCDACALAYIIFMLLAADLGHYLDLGAAV